MKKGRLLRALRAEQEPKMTQGQIARLVAAKLERSFSSQRYWQIENGFGAEPSTDEKNAVAAALKVKVSDIAWPEFAKAKAS